jgi:hypothetical protein
MKRYYFDLRYGNALARDEEGVELPDIEPAQEEARAFTGRYGSRCDPRKARACAVTIWQ